MDDITKSSTRDLVVFCKTLRDWWGRGSITRQEALDKAQPAIDELNRRQKQIAKKFGKRPYPINFNSFIHRWLI